MVFLNDIDTHIRDPVVQEYPKQVIALEKSHFKRIAEVIVDFVTYHCDKKIVGLGAGGYGAEITASMWLQTVDIFAKKLL